MREYWSANYQDFERAILTTREVGGDDGADKIRVICMAKAADTVQEPVTFIDIHSSLLRMSSRAACAYSGADGFFGSTSWSPSGRRASESASGEDLLNLGTCSLPTPTCCATAFTFSDQGSRADGMPFCDAPAALPRTDSW